MFKISILVCCFILDGIAHAQGPYPDGSFSFPPDLEDQSDQSTFLHWTEGTVVTIEWTSTYQHDNLYYAQFGDDQNSQALTVNTDANQFQWTVKDASIWPNRSIPFHFHVVNAEGSSQDQADGGFWSAGFFIPAADSSSTSSGLPTSTSKSSTTALTSSLVTSGVSSLISSSSAAAASSASTATSPDAALSGGSIAGIVIGSVVALAGFGSLIYWYGRRRAITRMAAADAQSFHHSGPNNYSDFEHYPVEANASEAENANKVTMAEVEGDRSIVHSTPAELG
ncbi:hypothetical protein K491DRAFT_676073 [Lophiostoma macrostomum CBS 122681]|uniref:Mid2 domain-containing protein n=1 Tax=Lophiostoma macrostomum CBS 122681 TaxID=1314788 RepID=A0A6A6THK0_9PLEO|nr:hypothetical protein K491DRAFT_676073 [Lophiostoma macrostomum CBS 122681]